MTTLLSGTTVNLSFPTEIGPKYVLEWKGALTNGAWNPLNTNDGTGAPIIVPESTQSDAQRFAQSRALQSVTDMAHIRLLMSAQASEAIPWPFLSILVLWLIVLFAGFGLLAQRSAMMVSWLFVGALVVAGALFLVVDMRHAYTGLIQISSEPLKSALSQIGR